MNRYIITDDMGDYRIREFATIDDAWQFAASQVSASGILASVWSTENPHNRTIFQVFPELQLTESNGLQRTGNITVATSGRHCATYPGDVRPIAQ